MANPSKSTKTADEAAVNDTVAPGPKGKQNTGVEQVNIPVSASNALEGEAGIQVPASGQDVETVIRTSSFDPQKSKIQNEFVENTDNNATEASESNSKVSAVLEEIFKNHNIDIVLQNSYRKKAGL